MRKSFILLGLVTASCTVAASQPVPPAQMAHPTHMPMGKIVSTPLIRTAATISGQPLRLPQGPAEMVATAMDIPPGGATAIHQHPWSRFVYVERGPVRITNLDTGQGHDFQTGQVLAEVVAQWHEGRAGNSPVRLVVIDLVPPGATNMVMKPAS